MKLINGLVTFSSLLSIIFCAEEYCHVSGRCDDGYKINTLELYSYLGCQTSCKNVTECNVFTVLESQSICEHFANCTHVEEDTCPDCLSG